MFNPLQTFRMPDKEKPTRTEIAIEFSNECGLCGAIKINHDIPTKDDI